MPACFTTARRIWRPPMTRMPSKDLTRIQEGTALIYPLSAMGAHVSDCPNHAVGRTTPFETRGYVALAGTFGYELDITRIPEEDRKNDSRAGENVPQVQ